jgi:GMP synthase (glutamine-hydrolysing)
MKSLEQPRILIIDLGSQYTLNIARELRGLGVRSAVLSPKKAGDWLKANQPLGIILSGGDGSVNDPESPVPPDSILHRRIPILGICYGMHWLANELNGKVESIPELKEFGPVRVRLNTEDPLFAGLDPQQDVWASHGDSVTVCPLGASQIARSLGTGGIAGFSNPHDKLWALQFHPEVIGTPKGDAMLSNFVFGICGCDKDWQPADIIGQIREEVIKAVAGRRAEIGMSGGVDSTTSGAIIGPALGDLLFPVTLDTGFLRHQELPEIIANVGYAGLKTKVVRCQGRFERALAGLTDAERKRKAFKKLYTRILEEQAGRFGAKLLIQGTLATDLIESGTTGGDRIKSHHNVGLKTWLKQIAPFRNLFKHEVRALAKAVGLPDSVCLRQPSPGPGLMVRVVGTPVTHEMAEIVRWADWKTTEILKRRGEMEKISQLVVALFGVRITGVKGDGRAYKYPIAVRPIDSVDFMTARGHRLSPEIEDEIISELTKHQEIGTVGFFYTPKPPETIEFE